MSGEPGALGERAGFHAWLQWLVDEQLAAAQRAALGAGMAQGVIHDLAVGVHPGGADAWAHQDLLVAGMSASARRRTASTSAARTGPSRRGTRSGWPPPATGRWPELFAAALRHAGGLRVDHVMGLFRLWWVPEGMTADRGAYVRYDHAASVAALAGQARAAGAPGHRRGPRHRRPLDPALPGRPRRAGHHDALVRAAAGRLAAAAGPVAADCMATVGTHDVPTVAGFASGDQVAVRARLGLLTSPEEQERARAAALIAGWRAALEAARAADRRPGRRAAAAAAPTAPRELTVALYGYLAATPALLLGVSLADAVGETRSQNIPGTSTEYPNWQIPLCDEAAGRCCWRTCPGSRWSARSRAAVAGEPGT